MTDYAISMVVAGAAGVFFAILLRLFATLGADLWAAAVLALAGVVLLLALSQRWTHRRP